MTPRCTAFFGFPVIVAAVFWLTPSLASDASEHEPHSKRILLLGQKPDTHPPTTHEYMAGAHVIAHCLQDPKGLKERRKLQPIVVQADNPWNDGPELLDGCDAVVVFLTEGAKWLSDDPDRLAAFQRLAKRRGGLCCIHWGMGTRELPPVKDFVDLFGGCHGGPDRQFKVGEFQIAPGPKRHPITSGISPFHIRDELYFDLKFPKVIDGHTALLETRIADVPRTIAWAWERNDGGRSFGFTGLHFHENWKQVEYRRLVIQGVLWTLSESIPEMGLEINIADSDLALPVNPAK